MMCGEAKERMFVGQHVLCRNYQVRLAPPSIANGTVTGYRGRPRWMGDRYEPGDYVQVKPIEGLGERDLHAIANGPIMEPVKLYLPAGKLSEAEYQERLKLDFERAGIADEAPALVAGGKP